MHFYRTTRHTYKLMHYKTGWRSIINNDNPTLKSNSAVTYFAGVKATMVASKHTRLAPSRILVTLSSAGSKSQEKLWEGYISEKRERNYRERGQIFSRSGNLGSRDHDDVRIIWVFENRPLLTQENRRFVNPRGRLKPSAQIIRSPIT